MYPPPTRMACPPSALTRPARHCCRRSTAGLRARNSLLAVTSTGGATGRSGRSARRSPRGRASGTGSAARSAPWTAPSTASRRRRRRRGLRLSGSRGHAAARCPRWRGEPGSHTSRRGMWRGRTCSRSRPCSGPGSGQRTARPELTSRAKIPVGAVIKVVGLMYGAKPRGNGVVIRSPPLLCAGRSAAVSGWC